MEASIDKSGLVLVAGAGGFIGGHLVADLRRCGFEHIRAVDAKPLSDWFQSFEDVECRELNLAALDACREAAEDATYVFNLAADMGGMGFIEANKALCMLSVLINTHLLMASREAGAERFFYASSACIYPIDRQESTDVTALEESAAYPALPEDGYGWEKLFSERMCRHFAEDFGLKTRVARYHNVYGPNGTYEGGREKAPAAICRKVAQAKLSGTNEIEIWGDGQQRRSFMYIEDCLRGTELLMWSDVQEPLNVGSAELVSVDELVDLVEDIAGVKLKRHYKLDAPQGVRGRNSDNTLIRERLGWQPSISLRDGLDETYRWIHNQMVAGQSHAVVIR
jgi:nucleoside-diphosphate-sugar epimerase